MHDENVAIPKENDGTNITDILRRKRLSGHDVRVSDNDNYVRLYDIGEGIDVWSILKINLRTNNGYIGFIHENANGRLATANGRRGPYIVTNSHITPTVTS